MTSSPPTAGAGDKRALLLNLAAYEVGWFACVLGAAGGWGDLGAAVAIALSVAHVVLAARPEREWPLLLAAAGLGLLVETMQLSLGILEPRGQAPGSVLPPLWILALWLQFGTVFHFCLRWLSGRYRLATFLGLVGGPLAFLAGERLGAASFGEPRAWSLAILGVVWAVALPTLVWVADRLGPCGRYRLFGHRAEMAALHSTATADGASAPRADRSRSLG